MSMEEPKKIETETPANNIKPVRRFRTGKVIGAAALAGTLLVGAVAGAVGMKMARHQDEQALLPPVAIGAMADDSLVAVKGQAVEFFGNKFIITDASGRALIDLGRAGEDTKLVAKDETVTVQGRFDNGAVHASMVVHADGRVDELRPAPPPHHGPKHGPRDEGQDGPGPRGPEDGPRS